jgi:hypothetical protein
MAVVSEKTLMPQLQKWRRLPESRDFAKFRARRVVCVPLAAAASAKRVAGRL